MLIDTSIITFHGSVRAKERCNFKNQRTTEKQVKLALQRGKRSNQFTSWERDYLDNESRDDCTAIAYNNFCYIVNAAGVCVTMYRLPTWWGKKKHYDGKTRIRNPKGYYRSNRMYTAQDMFC